MNALDIMKRPAAYVSGYENTPTEEQNRAKQLCWEYNRTAPNEQEKRRSILQTLLGTCSPMTGIQPDFHCDYGFNIHTHGLAVINYNCVIALVILLLFGGKKIPELMRGLGKGVKSFKDGVNDAKEEINKAKEDLDKPADSSK